MKDWGDGMLDFVARNVIALHFGEVVMDLSSSPVASWGRCFVRITILHISGMAMRLPYNGRGEGWYEGGSCGVCTLCSCCMSEYVVLSILYAGCRLSTTRLRLTRWSRWDYWMDW